MPRRRSRPEDPAEDDDEAGELEEEDEEPSGPPRRRRHPVARRLPVRRWKSGESEDEEDAPSIDELDETGGAFGWFHRPKFPVFYRARDSLYFEPLVAVAVVALLLVSLYAYAQNWPPAYVIESDSMQHGSHDMVGLINTGDLVIAAKISADQVIPYVVGAQSGYKTYGEYGDVILYHPNGSLTTAPVIHRAIAYIEADPNGTYSVPELQGQPCGSAPDAVYSVSDHPSGCGTVGLHGRLTLFRVGWQGVVVNVALSPAVLGSVSGYLTMGDNNLLPGTTPEGLPDQPSISELVQAPWIIGVARGMIPWVGSLKLLLGGNAGQVPAESWEFLGITIVGFFLVAAGIHYALRAEGIEDERRRELEAETESEEERPRRRWFVRRHDDEEEEEDEDAEEPRSRREEGRSLLRRLQPRYWRSERSGGRPSPSVRRGASPRHHRHRRSDRDDDDDL